MVSVEVVITRGIISSEVLKEEKFYCDFVGPNNDGSLTVFYPWKEMEKREKRFCKFLGISEDELRNNRKYSKFYCECHYSTLPRVRCGYMKIKSADR